MSPRSDVTSWAVVLMAATSLVLMICLYQIEYIVHGTLYNYGLRFSFDWATPYRRLTQIGFTLGWINIVTAFAAQLNHIKTRRKAEQPATAIEKAWEIARTPEVEKAPEESTREPKTTGPTKPPEDPGATPQPETKENNEQPQQPEKTPRDEQQSPEINPDETPTLAGL